MTRTNTFTLLCVVIRVVALWLVVGLVLALPGLIVGARATGLNGMNPWLLAIPFLAGVVIAGLLWLFAEKLARLALSSPKEHVFDSDLDAAAWFGIALATIGAWYFFGAMFDGVHLAVRTMVSARQRALDPGMDVPGVPVADVIVTVLQAVVGIALVLRGPGLAAVLHRLRYAGARAKGPSE